MRLFQLPLPARRKFLNGVTAHSHLRREGLAVVLHGERVGLSMNLTGVLRTYGPASSHIHLLLDPIELRRTSSWCKPIWNMNCAIRERGMLLLRRRLHEVLGLIRMRRRLST